MRWRQSGHRSRQADVSPQSPDRHDQFITFLKQAYLAFRGKGETQTDAVLLAVLFEAERRLGLRDHGWIVAIVIEDARHVLQSLAAEHFVREKRHPFHRDGSE